MLAITPLEAEVIFNVLRTIKEDHEIVPEIEEDIDDAIEIIDAILRYAQKSPR